MAPAPQGEGLGTRRVAQPPAARPPAAGEGLGTRQVAGPPAARPPAAGEGAGTRQITPAPDILPAEGTLLPGTMLQNRYKIIGVLGIGGMATVYKARDMRFANVDRLCAVKEMINMAPDPEIRQMAIQNFEREANILATTSHPAMPQIYDFFSESTRSYLVMELIDGEDIEDYLAQMNPDEFLEESQVVDWALQICDVLSYLHGNKPLPIVFRDLKPGNIMLDDRDRIRLIDFGIAKVFQTGQKGTMIGTEGYSPPEQYRGSAEPRGDVYALGATLHHLLTRQDPRLEPPFSFQERPITATNPKVNPQLEAVIMKALEYDIDKRYSSVEEFKKALMAATRRGSVRYQQPVGYGYTPTPDAGDVGDIMEIWRFACEDEVRSSPTVNSGIVYVGSYDNNLYALNAETGKFVWKYAADDGIASSPCVHNEQVLIGSRDRILYSISARTGRLEWTCPTQGRIHSSPRVEFGHVFFGSDDHHLYAASLQTGRIAWKVEMGGPVRSSVAFGEEMLYFGCEDGSVVALDIRGDVKWRFRARRAVTSSPCLDLGEGILVVGSMDWAVYALDAHSGWAVWRVRTGGPVLSSPIVVDGVIFIGSADKSMYALDARNGRVKWKYETEGQVTSNPAYANGALYFGSIDHHLYSLDAETGELRWRFKTGGSIPSSPAVEGDVVYIGSTDRYVYAVPT
jgi:outer membrane protein assembly factor BamB/tRNA A-37 threonylcarbamoyl transferase component Bud32